VLWELLERRGAEVVFHDPHVPIIRPTREHPQFAGRKSAPLTPETVGESDLVLLATRHRSLDYALIAERARLIVDTRNAFAGMQMDERRYFKA